MADSKKSALPKNENWSKIGFSNLYITRHKNFENQFH